MKKDNKKALYERIMVSVAKEVKKALNESWLNYFDDENIAQWWDKTKTPPQYIITKSNAPFSGRIEIVGTPYITKLKLLGYGRRNGEEYDTTISVGGQGWEGYFKYGKKKSLYEFDNPNWTPISYYYNRYTNTYQTLTSWDEIRELVNDRDWAGQLIIYRCPSYLDI
jgi:hypothetical protein